MNCKQYGLYSLAALGRFSYPPLSIQDTISMIGWPWLYITLYMFSSALWKGQQASKPLNRQACVCVIDIPPPRFACWHAKRERELAYFSLLADIWV